MDNYKLLSVQKRTRKLRNMLTGGENNIFTKRQTDRQTAEALKKNILGLVERGLTPSIMDIRYVKLAEYENREEDLARVYSDIFDELDEDECYE